MLRRLLIATRRETHFLSSSSLSSGLSSSPLLGTAPARFQPQRSASTHGGLSRSTAELKAPTAEKRPSLTSSSNAPAFLLQQNVFTQMRSFTTKGPRRQNKLKTSESEARKQPRRVKAFCTAEEYDFDELTKYLSKHHVTTFLSDTTLHIRKIVKNGIDEANSADEITSDIFYFKNGCIVAWGSTPEEEKQLLAEVRQFEVKPSELPESEEMEWILGAQSGLKYGSVIVIKTEAEERDKMHDQLAFSWGLVHSVKISALEEYAAMTLDKMRDIPRVLGKTGALNMTSSEIYMMFGQFLSLQGHLNSNLLETPDLYWEEPELEELYKKISRDLELQQRLKRLEERLNYGRELMEVLRTLTSEKHFTKLEKIIIILIATEVLLSIRHEIKDFLFGEEKKEE